jgi:predicted RND superfamily exporter protein
LAPSLTPAFQVAGGGQWVNMYTQQTYINQAIIGSAASVSIAFVVLSMSTLNPLVSFFAILTILCVVGSVFGLMVVFGWELGVIESVSAMVLAGLAVDYTVHLAHVYLEAPVSGRVERVERALAEMGVSVLGGALTSIFASFFLVFTVLQFFFKFGVVLMITISLSFIYAVSFFMALLAICGPTGACCSIGKLVRTGNFAAFFGVGE